MKKGEEIDFKKSKKLILSDQSLTLFECAMIRRICMPPPPV